MQFDMSNNGDLLCGISTNGFRPPIKGDVCLIAAIDGQPLREAELRTQDGKFSPQSPSRAAELQEPAAQTVGLSWSHPILFHHLWIWLYPRNER